MCRPPTLFENKLRIFFRNALLSFLPDNSRLRYLAALPQLRTWQRHYAGRPILDDVHQLYELVYHSSGIPFDYLEFGVWQGDSFKYWLNMVKEGDCRFWGFDSFTGLPEKWECFAMTLNAQTFDMGGKPPNIQDNRAKFVKGLFQNTLYDFLATFHPWPNLIIHLDADIYSAELYVLTQLEKFIRPGTLVIFDDFLAVTHDFRALQDYCSAYMRNYDVIGMTKNLRQVAIQFS